MLQAFKKHFDTTAYAISEQKKNHLGEMQSCVKCIRLCLLNIEK